MKKRLKVIIIILLVLFAFSFARDQIIKSAISIAGTKITGTKITISRFSLSLLRQSVHISGLRMYNPGGFSAGGVIINLPKVYVDFDAPSLLKGKLHLRKIDIELEEVGVEKNRAGELNVDSLQIAKEETQKPAKEAEPKNELAMKIDLLDLKIGRIVFKDYTLSGEPAVFVYDINIRKTYKNINSAGKLVALILSEPMKAAGIKGAKIYGISTLAGAAILPVAIATTFIGEDSAQQNFNIPFLKLYDVALNVLKSMGNVNKQNKDSGVINAQVQGVGVSLKLKAVSRNTTRITISARKYLIPKPQVANGVLYRISEELK